MKRSSRLAAGVAHDINNMLVVVVGYADAIIARLEDADRTRDELVELREAALRAAELAKELVAIGREETRPQPLDLDDVIAGIESIVRRLVGPNIELRLHRCAGLSKVVADRALVEQVVMNLVSNARDAMDGRGTLTIETANVAADEPRVLLTVSDSGVGMDDATMARMFEPFFTTKERGRGTGLGLAVVNEIVREHGGRIDVESARGRGTIFRVYFRAV